jgi:mitotic spindle assembly checkpoint protein MAD2B
LLAYVHTVLRLRSIYPSTAFIETRFHNTPIFQSRSPELCGWINAVIEAVYRQLYKGKVGIIGIEIYTKEDGQVVERYVFDVSAFPVMETSVVKEVVQDPLSPVSPVSVDAEDSSAPQPETLRTMKPRQLDEDTPPDLSEQLRATLICLVQRCGSLTPLAATCSCGVYMEMKSDGEAQSLARGSRLWVSTPPWETEQNSPYTDDVAVPQVTRVAIRSVRYPNISFHTWAELFTLQAESDVGSMSSSLSLRQME